MSLGGGVTGVGACECAWKGWVWAHQASADLRRGGGGGGGGVLKLQGRGEGSRARRLEISPVGHDLDKRLGARRPEKVGAACEKKTQEAGGGGT